MELTWQPREIGQDEQLCEAQRDQEYWHYKQMCGV